METIVISTEIDRLDVELIHGFISNTYWAKGRTKDEVNNCIKNSTNFGIYLNGSQVGYARVVSDFTIFAYLMDLFVVHQARGMGYSTKLMDYIINYPALKKVKNWKLCTADAHGLYKKYNFEIIKNPQLMMERNL